MSLPNICGFNKASEMGNDIFAPSIFLETCNFRCPYCMNSKLVDGKFGAKVDLEVVKKFVKDENCQWVMISGGEPTCTPQDSLIELLEEIKSWGCKIGMSTNGSNFRSVTGIIHLLNYVAMDIKAANAEDYAKISGIPEIADVYDRVYATRLFLAVTKLARDDFDYELRTTLFPPVINATSLLQIGKKFLDKNDKWVLQQFRHAQNMLDPSCKEVVPYTDDHVKVLMGIAKEYCNNVSLRYV